MYLKLRLDDALCSIQITAHHYACHSKGDRITGQKCFQKMPVYEFKTTHLFSTTLKLGLGHIQMQRLSSLVSPPSLPVGRCSNTDAKEGCALRWKKARY